ncbi:ARHGB factor, partial [Irena cyanogastra]|nr:ARHGB factor [Irena cyanogastra]
PVSPHPRIPVTPRLQDPEVQKHAAQILLSMLRQEEAELQERAGILGIVWNARFPEPVSLSQDLGFRAVEGELSRSLPAFPGSPQLPARFPRDSQDGDPGLESGPERGSERPQIIGPEEDCEPGSGSSESDSVFQDLGILKSRPAHLGVFLRFLFSQADPTPLLFHLCCDVCWQQSNPRECRALAREIWSVFLDRAA